MEIPACKKLTSLLELLTVCWHLHFWISLFCNSPRREWNRKHSNIEHIVGLQIVGFRVNVNGYFYSLLARVKKLLKSLPWLIMKFNLYSDSPASLPLFPLIHCTLYLCIIICFPLSGTLHSVWVSRLPLFSLLGSLSLDFPGPSLPLSAFQALYTWD